MKITIAAARVAVIAAALLGLMEGSASATSNPIPGVDIIVRSDKGPPFQTARTTTDNAGNFSSANLEPGKHLLSVKLPKAGSPGRSSIKLTGRSMEKGVAVFTVSITLGAGQPEPLAIEIPKGGGKIVGKATTADAPK